jgi:hypothetical protein
MALLRKLVSFETVSSSYRAVRGQLFNEKESTWQIERAERERDLIKQYFEVYMNKKI